MKKLIIGIGAIVLIGGIVLLNLPKGENNETSKSNIFGDNSNKRFENLLAFVPKNTTYLFGNKNALPEDYTNKQIDKMGKVVDSLDDIFNNKSTDKNSSSEFNFITNFYKDFTKLYKEDNLKKMGYEKGLRTVIYGYKLYPVLRVEIADNKAFTGYLNRIAKENNTSIEWEQCGQFQCLTSKASNDDMMTTFVVKEKSIAFGLYGVDIKDEMIKHLTEVTPSNASYSIKEFNALLAENNFKGYGDGFVNLEVLSNKLIEKMKKDIPANKQASFNNCSPIAKDIVKKIPKISFGTTQLSTETLRMLMVFNMDSNLTQSLQSISNKNIFTQRVANPLFDLGLNVNAHGLSTAITEFANYMINEGQKYGCTEIDAQALRQSSAMASMSIAMSLSQLTELYISINDLEIDKKKMMPNKVAAYALVSSPNPTSLLGMLKMLSPELAQLNIPTTGEEVDLLAALPKPTPPFISALTASIKDKVIALRVGDKPKMEAFTPNEHTILWAKVNNKKYYELIAMALQQGQMRRSLNLPNLSEEDKKAYDKILKKRAEKNEKAMKFMEVLYDSNTTSAQNIYVGAKGLTFEFIQQHPKN